MNLFEPNLSPKPFLKWAGGKGQLLDQFEKYFPKSFNTYIELFLGSGAVFLHLYSTRPTFHGILGDNSEELINCWKVVKNNPKELIKLLKEHRERHDKGYYYHIRALMSSNLSSLERAARLIYLNKTCYNGLYRVNSKGQFNVPIGSYKNPSIFEEENIYAVNQALQNVQLRLWNFEECLNWAKAGDFIYFDPPYYPISETSSFTGYTADSFSAEDQKKLAEVYRELSKKRCLLMLSNSDCDFIRELYGDFRIETVFAKRAINSKADRRGTITEVVVLSY